LLNCFIKPILVFFCYPGKNQTLHCAGSNKQQKTHHIYQKHKNIKNMVKGKTNPSGLIAFHDIWS